MAAVYWLTETGEVEPQQVCSVDFSDEGEAVEFAHHLYRSVHGFACRRQGFTIKDDDGSALYTWRWTSETGEASPTEDADTSAPPHRTQLSPPRYGHAAFVHRRVGGTAAVVGSMRRQLAALVAAESPLRLRQPRHDAVRMFKGLAARLAVMTRHVSAVWRRLTRWETSIEPAAPSRVRPKIDRLKPHRAR